MAKKTNKKEAILAQPVAPEGKQNPHGLDWETVMPIYTDPELSATEYAVKHFGIESPFAYRLRRLTQFDERWYSIMDDHTDEIRYCMSVTTFCGKSLGISGFLLNYLQDMGKEASDIHKKWTAEYGTFFHIEAGEFLSTGSYDFGPNGLFAETKLAEFLSDRIGDSDTAKVKSHFIRKFHKDMAALAQWVVDKNVKIIGVEFPILSYRFPIASVIDLVCEIDFNGGRKRAIVDFKTGANFYEDHELQLNLYRELWNEHFSELCPVEMIFNWRPKDFNPTKTPSYEFKNQTNNHLDHVGRLMVAVNEGWFDKGPRSQYYISGAIKLGDDMSQRGTLIDFLAILKENENDVTK